MSEIESLSRIVETRNNDADFWNNLMISALVLVAVSGIAVAMTTYMALWRTKQAGQAQSALIILLQKQALSLKMDILQAGARENLLVGDTRKKLIEALRPFTGQSVEVRYGISPLGLVQNIQDPAGPDVLGLADALIHTFSEAKWSIPPVPFPSNMQNPDGILIQITRSASNKTENAANALAKALKDVPLVVREPIRSGELVNNPRRGTVRHFAPVTPGGPAIETPLPEPTDETIVVVVMAHPK